jgi:hypothetical protein
MGLAYQRLRIANPRYSAIQQSATLRYFRAAPTFVLFVVYFLFSAVFAPLWLSSPHIRIPTPPIRRLSYFTGARFI